jgi:UDP-N-acetylmuramate: L-alanyl-gamma-D-glutamyl-meso-diaminopimelate ligase
VHQEAYARAFDVADHVLLAPPARTAIPDGERLDVGRLARELGSKARAMGGTSAVDAIASHLANNVRPGDTIALLSNGTFGGIHRKILTMLADGEHAQPQRYDDG